MIVKEINQVSNYQKMNFYLHVNRNNKKHKKSQLFSSEWFRIPGKQIFLKKHVGKSSSLKTC